MFTVIAQTRKLQKQCVISFPLHGIFSFFRWYSFLHSLFLHSTSAAAYLSAPGCAACVVHGRMDSRSCSAGDGWRTRKEQFWKRGVGGCVCVWTAGRWGSSLAKLVSTKEKTLGYFLPSKMSWSKPCFWQILTFWLLGGMLIALAVTVPWLVYLMT